MQFSKYCKRNEATIVQRQKHRRNNDVNSLELPLGDVKLDDNKSDEDFFSLSSSDIVGMVKHEFIRQPFIMTVVVNFSSEKKGQLWSMVPQGLFCSDLHRFTVGGPWGSVNSMCIGTMYLLG